MAAGYASVTSLKASVVGNGIPSVSFQETVVDGKPVEVQMLIPDLGTGGQTELLAADGQLFLGGAPAEPYGKKYVLLDPNSSNPQVKELYATYGAALKGSDLTQFLEFMIIAKDVTDLGAEDLNGVSTEKYSLVLDLTKLPTADVSESLKSSMGSAAALGITEVPCTFWLDDEGRIAQVEQILAVGGQTYTTLVQFSDYNVPLDLVAPDPADVAVL